MSSSGKPNGLPKLTDLIAPLIEEFFGPAARSGESDLKDPPPTREQMQALVRENQRLQGELSRAPLGERKKIIQYMRDWAREANKVGQNVLASELGSLAVAVEDGNHLREHPEAMPVDMIGDFEREQMNRLNRPAPVVPANENLAEKAESLSARQVVRDWLKRHVRPLSPTAELKAWLDWAAGNFLADPEIRAYLQPVSESSSQERTVERERVVAFLRERAKTTSYWNMKAFFNQTASDIAAREHWGVTETKG